MKSFQEDYKRMIKHKLPLYYGDLHLFSHLFNKKYMLCDFIVINNINSLIFW